MTVVLKRKDRRRRRKVTCLLRDFRNPKSKFASRWAHHADLKVKSRNFYGAKGACVAHRRPEPRACLSRQHAELSEISHPERQRPTTMEKTTKGLLGDLRRDCVYRIGEGYTGWQAAQWGEMCELWTGQRAGGSVDEVKSGVAPGSGREAAPTDQAAAILV